MNQTEIVEILLSISPLFIVKIFVMILLLFHLAVSVIILRQTKTMIKTVEAKIAPAIYLAALAHLLFSLFVFFWTLIFV